MTAGRLVKSNFWGELEWLLWQKKSVYLDVRYSELQEQIRLKYPAHNSYKDSQNGLFPMAEEKFFYTGLALNYILKLLMHIMLTSTDSK